MGLQVALMAVSTAFSVYQSYSQGRAQKAMYKLQAEQTRADSERRALQYTERGNETLRQLNKTMSANISKGYAGGVVGFDGSTKLINTVAGTDAGRDFMFDVKNAENAILGGTTQANIYNVAGNTAYSSGLLSAGAKLSEAAYKYSTLGSAPEATDAS